MDFDAFERRLMKLPPKLKHLNPEEWWDFWQGQVDLSIQDDPRLVGLLKVAQDRRNRALMGGQHWLEGTPLDGGDTPFGLLKEKQAILSTGPCGSSICSALPCLTRG